MRESIVKKILAVLLGSVLGYLIYYNLFMEIISVYCSGKFYYIISIVCLIICIIGFISIANLLLFKTIKKKLFILLVVTYFFLLILILCGRQSIERIFILNPLIGIKDLSEPEMLIESTLNFIVFIPFGYFFKNLNVKKTLILSIIIPVAIEFLQVLTLRGMFDTFDILLYFLGINFGRYLFKKIKINIK